MAFLEEPRLAGVPPGSLRFFELQRAIIQERPLMREIYALWYDAMLADAASVPGDPEAGELLELGSGGSFLQGGERVGAKPYPLSVPQHGGHAETIDR